MDKQPKFKNGQMVVTKKYFGLISAIIIEPGQVFYRLDQDGRGSLTAEEDIVGTIEVKELTV